MTVESKDFSSVTELGGDLVTRQQVASAFHRYAWAASQLAGKDVLEVACGSGPGLGLVARSARSLRAGDITSALVERVKETYGSRIPVEVMDAENLPFPDASLDVVMLFEALYYVPHPERFAAECRRVLRPGGKVLVTSSNKDMPDFAPSPFAHKYLGVAELGALFGGQGLVTSFSGYWSYEGASMKQRLLLPVKRAVVAMGLMPKTMDGKKLLKRLVFGKLMPMPRELTPDLFPYEPPTPTTAGAPDRRHRVVYCVAQKKP